jgi:sulfur relay (sulfurtransferase) complex TusBCD TusD component (DsrE family)
MPGVALSTDPMADQPATRHLFLGLVGAPYASDLLTSAVRLADEALRQRHRVTIWTCGYATTLTTTAAGLVKPRNLADWDTEHPSPAALASHLRDHGGGSLEWLVCRFCAEERGALDQLPSVRIRPPYEFIVRANAADVSLVLGVK